MEDDVLASVGFSTADALLLGGLLRLDALRPEGFDARSLADHAGVAVDVVRGLVTNAAVSGHAIRLCDGGDVYGLTPVGRDSAIHVLAELRGRRASDASPDAFAPLELLEAALGELRIPQALNDDRHACIASVHLELAGCAAELLALEAAGSPHVREFTDRLDTARLILSEESKPEV